MTLKQKLETILYEGFDEWTVKDKTYYEITVPKILKAIEGCIPGKMEGLMDDEFVNGYNGAIYDFKKNLGIEKGDRRAIEK